MSCSVFENDKTVKGWKADSLVACCDSNESGKNRDLQKHE